MDSMTNQLSNLQSGRQSLWIVPASVVRGRKVSDPTAAFRTLGATMVVQGSVARKGLGCLLNRSSDRFETPAPDRSAEVQDRSGIWLRFRIKRW